jgi:hypothetical protein
MSYLKLKHLFFLQMDSLVESTNGSIMSFEVNLTGNPAPVADLVNFTMVCNRFIWGHYF